MQGSRQRLRTACGLACALLIFLVAAGDAHGRTLRVCADPNNLPFSNERGGGFENRLAGLIARDLDATVEYTWFSQRKSFIKNSLGEGKCDLVMGAPAGMPGVAVTRPYYTSTYVFVSRADRKLAVTSLLDPRLSEWRIGIHVVDNDYAPPARALAARGLAANIRGYSLFGQYGEENPPARILDALARGDVDVAIVWGPLAGYFASRQKARLELNPVSPASFLGVPFTYEIAIAVRPEDETLRAEIDAAVGRQCAAIQALLAEYGVPQISGERALCDSPPRSSSVSSR